MTEKRKQYLRVLRWRKKHKHYNRDWMRKKRAAERGTAPDYQRIVERVLCEASAKL